MSTSTNSYKQFLRAKSELEASLANARSQRSQWLAANRENPTQLTKREVDHITKKFKTRLLSVEWDCQDLEELINSRELTASLTNLTTNSADNSTSTPGSISKDELYDARELIAECREEIKKFTNELDDTEWGQKVFNRHGITLPSSQTASAAVASMLSSANGNHNLNGTSKYERLNDNDTSEIHFDKSQVVVATNAAASANSNGTQNTQIVNNALYDHFGDEDDTPGLSPKGFNASEVFNNLTRPVTNVYMNPNENEVILDMLETEYYQPPAGLQALNGGLNGKARLNLTMRKLFDTDRNRFMGTIVLLLTFPFVLVFFFIGL